MLRAGLLALALVGALGASSALAGPPWERGGHGWWHHHRSSPNPWGGFWGGVLGGWIGSQFNKPAEIVPGTPSWYAYCSNKYRSFDPATGTYLSYEGFRRPCV